MNTFLPVFIVCTAFFNTACANREVVYDVAYRDVIRPGGAGRSDTQMKMDEAACAFAIDTSPNGGDHPLLWTCMRSKGWQLLDAKKRIEKSGPGF